MPKKRRDIDTLTEAELADYVHALDILRQRSAADPDDPAGYTFQAGLHNDMFIGPCEHGSDLFLPWHRAHLHYFEQLLQEADPPRTANVTVPYWDWLHAEPSGKFPPAFSKPGLDDPERDMTDAQLPPDTLEIVTAETDPGAFGGYPEEHPGGDYGRLELGPHNTMHPFFIGGKMADPERAAEDPIYFSFHCFIDLMWAEWQRRNQSPAPTSPEATLRGFTAQPKHKVKDFQSVDELGYEYEYTDKLEEAFAVETTPVPPKEVVATESLEPLFDAPVSSELEGKARLEFGFPKLPEPDSLAVVRLDQLKIPTSGSYMLHAYVHPRDVSFQPDSSEFAERHSVGYVTVWRAHAGGAEHAHAGHAHHPTECTVRFDVTRALGPGRGEGVPEHVLTLQYIPAPTTPGAGAGAADLVQEVALKDVLMEVYR